MTSLKRLLAWLLPPSKPPLRPLAQAQRAARLKRLRAIDLACDTRGLYRRKAARPYGLRAVLMFEDVNGVTADPDDYLHADKLTGAAYHAIHLRHMRRAREACERLLAVRMR